MFEAAAAQKKSAVALLVSKQPLSRRKIDVASCFSQHFARRRLAATGPCSRRGTAREGVSLPGLFAAPALAPKNDLKPTVFSRLPPCASKSACARVFAAPALAPKNAFKSACSRAAESPKRIYLPPSL